MHKSYGVNEIREMFLKFFETKDHLRLPSFSLIPQNDASLLLINSGMAPMKPYFTGEVEPPRHRVCTCQKCIRTGDIENIGKTARHGTYFEMLGNFSFGDYFKKEAITWCWEFLTSPEWLGLEADRLYPSVFAGNETTPADNEAFEIWNKDVGIPAERIYRFGKEDNFWEHGSGPCGPCSEVYYDRGPEYGCGKPGCTVGCDCDRYIEIWNNVFSQFNNDGQGNYTELKQKNIDVGAGLERIACVSQNVDSLFDVDTVMNITNKVSGITGATYGQSHKSDVSLRVITDHIRSATMMICDGVLPSNEGRGYVLRRLLRRAARHGKLLGVNRPFLYEVCAVVIRENEVAYPDLKEKEAYITRIIRMEEESFAKTIDSGMKIFTEMLNGHKEKSEKVFSGADAFKLYDTYGFPIDLTIEMVEEEGMSVDLDGFKQFMEEQRTRARKAREALGDLGWAGIEFGKDVPATEFIGYDRTENTAKVLSIVADGEFRSEIAAGVEAILVLDQTVMYAEMGGQTADHGSIKNDRFEFVVTDVQKNKGGKFLHYGKVVSGGLQTGDTVTVSIDTERRRAIMRAHTATHLLDKALRTVLGDHVHQSGSLVEEDYLRFDFTHFSAMTAGELSEVSRVVNDAILEGYSVAATEMPIEEAKKTGAIALFSEKYGDVVRVVDMGNGYSVEFCGGTHLDNTAKAGLFHINSEFSVASGVRRIEAATGRRAMDVMNKNQELLFRAAAELKVKPADLRERTGQMTAELRELRQTIEKMKAKEFLSDAGQFLLDAKTVKGLHVVSMSRPGLKTEDMRKLGDFMRDKDAAVVALLAGVSDGKITFQAICGKEAVSRGIKAGDIIKNLAPICGGKGGGRPDSATGGGSDLLKLDDALAALDDYVNEHAK
ncbi:MAG: alanine--tRNA ligase [Oscillospiraceae bacterium]|nr:alanine--tRNA ligase [Oscillospiraceae bacterium]